MLDGTNFGASSSGWALKPPMNLVASNGHLLICAPFPCFGPPDQLLHTSATLPGVASFPQASWD